MKTDFYFYVFLLFLFFLLSVHFLAVFVYMDMIHWYVFIPEKKWVSVM